MNSWIENTFEFEFNDKNDIDTTIQNNTKENDDNIQEYEWNKNKPYLEKAYIRIRETYRN